MLGTLFNGGQPMHHRAIVASSQCDPNHFQSEGWIAMADRPHRGLAGCDDRVFPRPSHKFGGRALKDLSSLGQNAIDNVHA
jgi:hypothetical protein